MSLPVSSRFGAPSAASSNNGPGGNLGSIGTIRLEGPNGRIITKSVRILVNGRSQGVSTDQKQKILNKIQDIAQKKFNAIENNENANPTNLSDRGLAYESIDRISSGGMVSHRDDTSTVTKWNNLKNLILGTDSAARSVLRPTSPSSLPNTLDHLTGAGTTFGRRRASSSLSSESNSPPPTRRAPRVVTSTTIPRRLGGPPRLEGTEGRKIPNQLNGPSALTRHDDTPIPRTPPKPMTPPRRPDTSFPEPRSFSPNQRELVSFPAASSPTFDREEDKRIDSPTSTTISPLFGDDDELTILFDEKNTRTSSPFTSISTSSSFIEEEQEEVEEPRTPSPFSSLSSPDRPTSSRKSDFSEDDVVLEHPLKRTDSSSALLQTPIEKEEEPTEENREVNSGRTTPKDEKEVVPLSDSAQFRNIADSFSLTIPSASDGAPFSPLKEKNPS